MKHPAVRPNDTDGLIPGDLIERAKDYARASKSEGTLRAYTSVWAGFSSWCGLQGLVPLPASSQTIVAYIVDRADAALRPQTIKKHLAAISQAHKMAGFASPVQTEAVSLVMQGLRRTKGISSAPKKALRVDHIKQMVSATSDTSVGIRDKAILLTGFMAGLRRSEIVGLDVGDVTFEPEGAVLHIRRSKRDQEGKGRSVPVPRGHYQETCPVRALQRWLAVCGAANGPLFIRLDPGSSGERLTDKSVAAVVKKAAEKAGLDSNLFAGHSLRRGFCTETARAGASEREIARTTGHTSMVVLAGYIEAGTLFEQAAGRRLDL